MEKYELLLVVNEAYRTVLVSVDSGMLLIDATNPTDESEKFMKSEMQMITECMAVVLFHPFPFPIHYSHLLATRVAISDDRTLPTLLVSFPAQKKGKKVVELAFPPTSKPSAQTDLKRQIQEAISQATIDAGIDTVNKESGSDVPKSPSAKKDRKKRVGSEKGDLAVCMQLDRLSVCMFVFFFCFFFVCLFVCLFGTVGCWLVFFQLLFCDLFLMH
jgi:hypothetical protein